MRALARVLVSALVLTSLAAVRASPSDATVVPPQSFVTMFSEPHESIGDGMAQSWRTGKDSISISSADDIITVEAKDGSGSGYRLRFAAPPGKKLEVGTYLNAERAAFRSPGHPGIDISGNGNGCNTDSGQFRVLDIAPDLSRLWLVYEQHCGQGLAALFGEIRYGMPVVDARASIDGNEVVWPEEYVGWAGRPAEVRVTATSNVAIPVGEAVVTGAGFTLLGNTCPATLLPGKQCTLTVGFKPSDVGTRHGALTVIANGRTRRVQLEGAGFLPGAAWLSQGDPGEHLGSGFVELSPEREPRSSSSVSGWGSSTTAGMTASNGYPEWGGYFSATFQAPAGQQLLPGSTFTDVMKYPLTSASVAGMDVIAWETACDSVTGSFTVRSATYDGSQLTSYVIDFVQHCNGAAPAYRGSLYWNAGVRPAVRATATTIAAARSTVTYGATTSVTGILRQTSSAQPVPSARVFLYSKVAGSNDWRYRSSTTTTANGSYSFAVRPTRSSDFRVQHFGSLTTVPSKSASVRVSVRPRVTLTAAKSAASVGTKVRLRAGVTPARPGQVVLLQRYAGGVWRTVQRSVQPSTGPTVFMVRLQQRGWYMFRARTPVGVTLAAGVSAVVRVRAS